MEQNKSVFLPSFLTNSGMKKTSSVSVVVSKEREDSFHFFFSLEMHLLPIFFPLLLSFSSLRGQSPTRMCLVSVPVCVEEREGGEWRESGKVCRKVLGCSSEFSASSSSLFFVCVGWKEEDERGKSSSQERGGRRRRDSSRKAAVCALPRGPR